jgi:hypothetical protein
MDPVSAAILLGSLAIGTVQADQQRRDISRAQHREKRRGIQNQNAIVEEGFKKRTQGGAVGLGQPLGNKASQQGGILQGLGDGQASILG